MGKSASTFAGLGRNQAKEHRFSEETIAIDAGKSQTMGLGAYDIAEPTPRFDLMYEPELKDSMGASLERLDIPGRSRYVMMYHFHNFSHVPCTVTVRLHE